MAVEVLVEPGLELIPRRRRPLFAKPKCESVPTSVAVAAVVADRRKQRLGRQERGPDTDETLLSNVTFLSRATTTISSAFSRRSAWPSRAGVVELNACFAEHDT